MSLSSSNGAAAAGEQQTLADRVYHKEADRQIEGILERLEELGDDLDLDGFDVMYSSGVLTLRLGDKGTFVINKQPPNKQIWLSSPISGPKRYDFSNNDWLCLRDGQTLVALLNSELSTLLEHKVDVTPRDH